MNTVPLVWGMLHGEQREQFDLSFGLPAQCADRLASAAADIGLVPSIELTRQKLAIIQGAGIACRGPVRSILLVSKVPYGQIRTLAVDSSSRTSVELARVILSRKYGSEPAFLPTRPDFPAMLESADACLIIGDPALRLDVLSLPFLLLDLGTEWTEMTGLPMVFAVWSARSAMPAQDPAPFLDSLEYGMERLDDIVALEAAKRSVSPALAKEYLSRNIVFRLGPPEYRGLALFLQYAEQLKSQSLATEVTV